MKYTVDKQEKYIIIKLSNDKLDTLVAPQFKTELITMNAEGANYIILDLADVKFCDSSGLSAILVANRLCNQTDGAFFMCGLNDNVKKLITISQLDKVLNIFPTCDECIDAVFLYQLEKDLTKEQS